MSILNEVQLYPRNEPDTSHEPTQTSINRHNRHILHDYPRNEPDTPQPFPVL